MAGSSTHYKNASTNNWDRALSFSTDPQYNGNYFNTGTYQSSYTPPSSYQNWAMNQGLGYGALDSYYGGLLSPDPVADVSTYPGDEVGTPVGTPETDIYGGLLGPPAPAIRNQAVKFGHRIGQKLNSIFGGALGGQGIGQGIGPNDNYVRNFGNPGHGDTGNQGGAMKGVGSLDHERFRYDKSGNPIFDKTTNTAIKPATAAPGSGTAPAGNGGFRPPPQQAWSFPQYSQQWAFQPPRPNNQPPTRRPPQSNPANQPTARKRSTGIM